LIEKYEIGRGFPVVLLLKSDGTYIDRIRGFGDKDNYWMTLTNYTRDLYTPEYYQNKLNINPKDCESMVALAKKYHDRHMIKEALKWFESSVKYDSCKKNALTWFVLSRLYAQQGKSRKALFACEIAAELDPDNSQIQSILNELKNFNKK
jgi:tetratricopeptide (TPR) repeat protein